MRHMGSFREGGERGQVAVCAENIRVALLY